MNSYHQVREEEGLTSYISFVNRLAKDMGPDILNRVHAALGVCGEAGELADAIKKEWVYNKPEDRVNIIEELGDINFYMTMIQQLYGISDYEIIKHNTNKLSKRYKEGYSDIAAQERADKIQFTPTEALMFGVNNMELSPLDLFKPPAVGLPITQHTREIPAAELIKPGPAIRYRLSRSHTDAMNGIFFAGSYDTHSEAIRAAKGNAGYYIDTFIPEAI